VRVDGAGSLVDGGHEWGGSAGVPLPRDNFLNLEVKMQILCILTAKTTCGQKLGPGEGLNRPPCGAEGVKNMGGLKILQGIQP